MLLDLGGDGEKNNHTLVEQSFHSTLCVDQDLKHNTLHPGDFVCWKSISRINSPQSCWPGLYQGLLLNP